MIYFFLIILNCLILFFYNYIQKKLNIYDYPSEDKIHTKKVPLLGGLIFLFNITIYLVFLTFFQNKFSLNIFGFTSIVNDFVFIISIVFLFFLGLIDDKKNLSATIRLILLIAIVSLNLVLNSELNINYIKLSFVNNFSIESYSFFWTLICFLLFINAFNFFDGINLQSSGLIFVICLFFFIKNIFVDFFIVIMISNILFSYLNYNSRTFLGNSGSFFLPFLFGGLFISAYNNDASINADEIVILMLIPGIDLMRLFFLRLLKKISPFQGDRNHIHHLLLKKYPSLIAVGIIQILIWLPFLILQIFGIFYIALFIQLSAYIFLTIRYKN